jgi:hypothetical protein
MKKRLYLGLFGVAALALTLVATVSARNLDFTNLTDLQKQNVAAMAGLPNEDLRYNKEMFDNDGGGDEGTAVGSCARAGGPEGKYDRRMFCDSRTDAGTIYPCPKVDRMDYYVNMDRCTKK